MAASRFGIVVALLVTVACGGGDDLTAPLSGSIEVGITTVDPPSDAVSYQLSVDGGEFHTVGDTASDLQAGLAPGTHTVELAGMAADCAADGPNPRSAEVSAGHTARVVFRVTCTTPPAQGSLVVAVATGGVGVDADGYTVVADPSLASPVGANGTVLFPSLDAGAHVVRLSGIADNCTAPTSPDTVVVAAGDTAHAAFQVTCWPPLAGQIGFSRSSNTEASTILKSLYVINADGQGIRRLTTPIPSPDNFVSGDEWPAWSPDGTRLAFVRDDRIFVADRGAGGAVQLTPDTLFPEQTLPRWSPDGRTILFLLGFAGSDDGSPLYSINADGTGLRRIPLPIEDATGVVWFSWAPNGRRIAAVVSLSIFCCSPESHLFLLNPDGSEPVEVTDQGSPIFSGMVEWSPDGSRLALISNGISLKDTLTTPRQRILTRDAIFDSAAWSPDGNRLVFSMALFGDESLGPDKVYVINKDGTGLVQLTDPFQGDSEFGVNDESPVWIP